MKESRTSKYIGIEERKSPPVLTAILDFLIIWTYCSYQSTNNSKWIIENAFQASKVIELFTKQQFGQICSVLFNTNLVTINLWQLFLAIYFISLFGIPVEKRLGPLRFISIILLSASLSWLVQLWDVTCNSVWSLPLEHFKRNVYFFSPTVITLALAGAYMVLIPQKEKDLSGLRLPKKDRAEIFNRTQAKSVTERFGLPPGLFFAVFIVYVYIQRYSVVLLSKDSDIIGFYAGLSALIIGFFVATFVHVGLESTYQEHPLKHAAIKHYYELLDLDVGHENAVKGAAKSLGLPDYKVEGWVKKSKGKLRPT